MKRIIVFLMSLFLMVTLSACGNSENTISDDAEKENVEQELIEECKQDLTKTLDEIKNSSTNENSYIYYYNLSATSSTSNNDDGINKKIASLVEYSISKVSINGEDAEASVKMTAPDIYKLLIEIASNMQENNTDLLLEQLNDKLDGKVSAKEYEVTVKLKLVNEHWYLVPNGELANAISGGIIEQYSTMGQNITDELLEEEEPHD